MSADEVEIRDVYRKWFAAMETADAEAVLVLVTNDVTWKSPAGPAVIGRDALRERLAAFHAQVTETVDYEVQEVGVAGDWAFALVREVATIQPRAGGEAAVASGLHLSILRRDEDGWQIACDVGSLD
jgi:uncharacterized protein (TIGR02246 family)